MMSNVARIKSLARNVSQSLLSLSFNITGIIAGTLIASYFDILDYKLWGFLIYPGILSVRGAIGGIYSGRLSTALHLGTIEPSFRDNTHESYLLISSIIALTFISSMVMSIAGSIFGWLFMEIPLISILEITTVIISTLAVSLLFISPITFSLSIISFNRGLDPDVVVYPVVSTVADIIVTAFYLAMVWSTRYTIGWILQGFIVIVFTLGVYFITTPNLKNEKFRRSIKEFILTILMVSVIVNLTGSVLENITDKIGRTPEIYAVYPALIDTVGDVGSIGGSIISTKLALGTLTTSLTDILANTEELLGTWIASLSLFWVYSLISSMIYGIDKLSGLLLRLTILNLSTIPIMTITTIMITIFTSKKGWDPDNFIIPIESALSDGVTTLFLFLILMGGI
ncbi:MAG: magnesium transporter [Candidatus Bathyarchaeia archaeon]